MHLLFSFMNYMISFNYYFCKAINSLEHFIGNKYDNSRLRNKGESDNRIRGFLVHPKRSTLCLTWREDKYYFLKQIYTSKTLSSFEQFLLEVQFVWF